jgi:heme exporter protein A
VVSQPARSKTHLEPAVKPSPPRIASLAPLLREEGNNKNQPASNMAFALESDGVRKMFGHFTALNSVTLSVQKGEFVALFGRNGAGKTTFLKIAATLMRPTKGDLRIEGVDVRKEPEEARRHIGFLSHNTFVYRDLSALENLKFFCRLYSVDASETRLMDLLDRVGLRRRAHDAVRSFSRGLHQRVGIARVFLHNPSLILLDEPYTGLDAHAVEMLNGVLDEAVQAGKTVILTTHDLDQGLRAANRALIMDRGKVAFSGEARDPAVRDAYAQFVRFGDVR